jgi:hypothetical protein
MTSSQNCSRYTYAFTKIRKRYGMGASAISHRCSFHAAQIANTIDVIKYPIRSQSPNIQLRNGITKRSTENTSPSA